MNIYHRIYKLHQRNISAQQIAVTTGMPLKSVRSIIKRFNQGETIENGDTPSITTEHEPYIDFIVHKQHKYTIIDISGHLTKEFSAKTDEMINKIAQSSGILIALKGESITSADPDALSALSRRARQLLKNGKTLVIFSPSDALEAAISKTDIENHVKILGTIGAFEEHMRRLTHRG